MMDESAGFSSNLIHNVAWFQVQKVHFGVIAIQERYRRSASHVHIFA